MFKRIAPACAAAALLMLANGCCCTQPYLCGDAAVCDSAGCDSSGCTVGCAPKGPLGGCVNRALTCGSGCGEVYWGEWANDPPACSDPCDDYGNWTGEAYYAPRCNPLQGLRHLWGYRYAPAGCDVACDSYATPEFLPAEEGTEQQLVPPKPEAEAAAKRTLAGRRVRQAIYSQPAMR